MPFHYNGEALSGYLVADVASVLDEEKVPFVLWGNYLLAVFGIPTVVEGIPFVVEDADLDRAYTILESIGFSPCTLGTSCVESKDYYSRQQPAPTKHLHISRDNLVIRLFKKSEMLWKIPHLSTVSPEDAEKPDIILASDPRRVPSTDPSGNAARFLPNLHPVRIPSAWRTVEACILLAKRDGGGFWLICYVYYFFLYVKDKDVFNEEDLEPSHKAIFQALGVWSETENPYKLIKQLP